MRFLLFALMACCFTSHARIVDGSYMARSVEAKVYCSARYNQDEWEWLPNKISIITTEWYYYLSRNMYIPYYEITKEQYRRLEQECANYFPDLPVPRPSLSIFSGWYAFTYRNDYNFKQIRTTPLVSAYFTYVDGW